MKEAAEVRIRACVMIGAMVGLALSAGVSACSQPFGGCLATQTCAAAGAADEDGGAADASGSEPDGDTPREASTGSDPSSADATSGDGGGTPVFVPTPPYAAALGDPCVGAGARTCLDDRSSVDGGIPPSAVLECVNGAWALHTPCVAGEEWCDTSERPTRATCQPIDPECRDPGIPRCADGAVRLCSDPGAFVDTPCGAHEECNPSAAACECVTGFVRGADGCVNTNECATGNGGCDPLTFCRDTDGGRTCSDCPRGFVGTGADGCTPALAELTTVPGTLVPPFAPEITSYSVTLPLTVQSIAVAPRSDDATLITANGVALGLGSGWSEALDFGVTNLGLTTSYDGRPGLSYSVTITRGRQEAFLKGDVPSRDEWFGQSVAVTGDTAFVGATPLSAPGAVHVFRLIDGAWTHTGKLQATYPRNDDRFGEMIAASGDRLVVGANADPSGATTVNGDASDTSAPGAGAVYVYKRSGDTWTLEAYLKAYDATANAGVGKSVAIDGNLIATGAPLEPTSGAGTARGVVHLFAFDGVSWVEEPHVRNSVTGTTTWFGSAVALSGNTLVVGAHGEGPAGAVDDASGVAYVYTRTAGSWPQQARLRAATTEAGDHFGERVSISGDVIVVGAPREDGGTQGGNGVSDAGAAYVFTRSGGTWTEGAYLKAALPSPNESFGDAVVVRGGKLLVGSPRDKAIVTGIGGDPTMKGNLYSGSVHLFTGAGASWSRVAYLKASDQPASPYGDSTFGWYGFGTAVAVDGDTIVVGQPSEHSNATGVGGSTEDTTTHIRGAAYVLR